MGLGAPRQWSRAMAGDMEASVSVKCRAWALLFAEFIMDRQKQLLGKVIPSEGSHVIWR